MINNSQIIDSDKILINGDSYFAHKNTLDNGCSYEKLGDHLKKTMHYFFELVNKKHLGDIFFNIFNTWCGGKYSADSEEYIFFLELVCNTIYFHDLGKINPLFQNKNMDGSFNVNDDVFTNSNHSFLGALVYFLYYLNKINQKYDSNDIYNKDRLLFLNLISINATIIRGHHGLLKSPHDTLSEIKENISDTDFITGIQSLFKIPIFEKTDSGDIKEVMVNIADTGDAELKPLQYIYSRLIFGLLTHSDILSTASFICSKNVPKDMGLIENKKELKEMFESNHIVSGIRDYSAGNKIFEDEINCLRSDLFIESEKKLQESLKHKGSLFQLEAPTGSGKTITSLNLALNIIDKKEHTDRVFYAFPFNNIVEQTHGVVSDIFGNAYSRENIAVYNSLTAPEETLLLGNSPTEKNEEINYDKLLMEYQFIYTPIVISTNIKLFDILFGTTKSSAYPLPLLCNSVIIIDEVQAYKNAVWSKMIKMLKKYSELLNIDIIIMSATVPSLNGMLKSQNMEPSVVRLIDKPEYFFRNKVFKDRVKIDYTMLSLGENEVPEQKTDITFEFIKNKIKEDKNNNLFLVEFIFQKRAREFYDYLKKILTDRYEIFIMTGNTDIRRRKYIINRIKKNSENKIILIATQTIEAGVDIDMDVGFKNISLLDAEEQFLGRINRNFKKKFSVVYPFDLDDAKTIYRNDIRADKEFTIKTPEIQKILEGKDFSLFFEKINQSMDKNNKFKNTKESSFENDLLALRYSEITKFFRLIENRDKYTLFLNRQIDSGAEKDKSADIIWKQYKEILSDRNIGIAERKIKLMYMRTLMEPYLYDVFQKPDGYNDFISGIYFYEDSDNFFEDGEFYPERVCGDRFKPSLDIV